MAGPFVDYEDERRRRLIAEYEALTPEERARIEERLGLRPSNPFERYVTHPLARIGRAARNILPDADPADVADMQAPGGFPDAVQAPFVSFLPRSFETEAPEPLQPAARVIRGVISPGGIATLGLGGARLGFGSVAGSVAGASAGAPFGPWGETVGSMVGGVVPGARVAPRAVGILPGVPEEIVGGQAARTSRKVQDAVRAQELRELAEQAPSTGTLGDPGEAIPGTEVYAPRTPREIDTVRLDAVVRDIESGGPSPFRQFEPGAQHPETMEQSFGRQRPVDADLLEDPYGAVGYRRVQTPEAPLARDPFADYYGSGTGRADITPLGDITGTPPGPGPIYGPLEEAYGPYAFSTSEIIPPEPDPNAFTAYVTPSRTQPPPDVNRRVTFAQAQANPATVARTRPAMQAAQQPILPANPYATAAGGATPPPTPPAAPATGATPPTPLPPPVTAMPPEVERSLKQARAMRAQDLPGAISKALVRGPLRAARDMWTPARTMPENIHVGQIAENSTTKEVGQRLYGSRMPLLHKIDELFGPGVRNGARATPAFRGTPQQAANELTGTFKDIADNPELYDLSPAQQQFLADFDARNTALVGEINNGYGADIGLFSAKPGGAFLSNIDRSEEVLSATEAYYGHGTGTRAVASGRMQPRTFQTARERMAADPSFKPNTDVAELLRGMDQSKARAAGGETLRWAVGGLEKQPTGSATAHGYKQVDLGGGERRWFPPEEAAHLERIKEQAAKTGLLRFGADVQATVLGADFSPLFIQGQQALLFDPDGVISAIARGDMKWTPDSIAEVVAKDPKGWGDFAFATGRSITEPVPGEFGPGLLQRLPKVGAALNKGTTRMYNAVQVLLKGHFDEEVARLEAAGQSHENAIAIAGDYIQRIVPQTNPTRYGLSARQAQIRRLPLTSVSFVQKSAELLADATRGFGKIITAGQIAKMTPKERLAVTRVTRSAAIVGTISVMSAVIEAKRTGQDPLEAAKRALNPNSSQFLSLVAFDHRVPLGGPLRALFAAIYPRPVEGSPVPVPFAGILRYLENRIQPALSTAYHVAKNTDYRGRPIFRKGYDNAFVTGAKIAAYIAENITPASVQSVAQNVRTGETPVETAVEGVGQVAGQNIQKYRTISDLRRDWAKDLAPYKALPANASEARAKGVHTRDRYRIMHPQVEAQLFITGQVNSLSTLTARLEAVRLMKENRLRVADIRSLEPRDYDSVEHRSLRRFFANKFGESYVEGKLR